MKRSTLNIYRASAGSGKTFTLTAEYLRLMVQPQADAEYQATLAVTFTNKATGEMKERILASLYAIGHSNPDGEDMLHAVKERLTAAGTPMGDEAVREGCRKALSDILHDYSRFRVETIDSFFQSILKNMARELGLSANLQVELSDSEVTGRAVDRIIDNLESEKDTRENVMGFLRDRLDSGERWKIAEDIKNFSHCIYDREFQEKTPEEKALLADSRSIGLFRKELRDRRETLEKECAQEVSAMEFAASDPLLDETCGKSINTLRGELKKLSEGNTPESKTWEKFQDDPTSPLLKAHRGNSEAQSLLEALHSTISDKTPHLIGILREIGTIKLIQRNISPLSLLDRIDREVKEINHENERFDLARTPLLLAALLEGTDAPFYFDKIGAKLRNVMIDEFQDTSTLQWQIFKTLLFENQAVGGSNLIVGDIKQSIYRWRGGAWSLLHGLKEELSQWNPHEEALKTNWRSGETIIRFNNDFFTKAARQLDSLDPDASFRLEEIYNDVCQEISKKKQGLGYVRLTLSCDEEAEGNALHEMMEEMLQLHEAGLPYEEMAILCRTKSNITDTVDYFAANAPEELQIVSDEAFLLKSSTTVRLIVDALRILLAGGGDDAIPCRSFIRLYKETPDLEEDFNRDSMASLYLKPVSELLPAFLTDERETLSAMPLYELIETLYKRLRLERIRHEDAYWHAFLDIVRTHLQSESSSLPGFLSAWEDNYQNTAIPSGKVAGVRILTIHKAKGLEYHSVFMPFCAWDIERDKDTNLWCETGEGGDLYNRLGAMPVNLEKRMANSFYDKQYEEEHLQKRVDALNELYVAFTRPTCNLMVWTKTGKNAPANYNVAELITDVVFGGEREGVYETGEKVTKPLSKGARSGESRMNPTPEGYPVSTCNYEARLHFVQSNESERFTSEEQNKIDTGKLYHYIFSQVHDLNDTGRVLAEAVQRGLVSPGEEERKLSQYLSEIMQEEHCRSWFDPANEVWNECSILLPRIDNGRKRRPDRVVRRGDTITIIDYKFGHWHSSYPDQVREYKELVQKMYPQCTVEGWLWFVDINKIRRV